MSYAGYVICATQRTGSTLLCDVLRASGAGWPESYFRTEDADYWAEQWGLANATAAAEPAFNSSFLSAMRREGMGGSDVFGLRLMWSSVDNALRQLDADGFCQGDILDRLQQAFGPLLFIHLSRSDKLAQAVSLVRAEQSGLWHVAPDGAERERLAPDRPPAFDPDRIAACRERLTTEDAAWAALFERNGVRPLRLRYEQVAADPRGAAAEVLAALGRDPGAALQAEVATKKLADAVSADWIARLRAE